MLEIKELSHIIAIGRTQTGKTTLIKDGLIPILPRFIMFDVAQRDNYQALCNVSTSNINEALQALNKGLNVHYRSVGNSHLEIEAEYNAVCYAILNFFRHYCVVSDEAADLSTPNRIPDYCDGILRRGLGTDILHITATQRPQLCSKNIFTQSLIKILFPVDDYDIKACRSYIPHIEKVSTLGQYEAIITTGKEYEIIKVKKRF